MSEAKGELIPVLEQIERDKGIKKEEIIKLIEQAVASAYRKHSGLQVNLVATIDPITADIQAFVSQMVVEQVVDPFAEVSLSDARKKSPKIAVGEELRIPVQTDDFSRIAAQTAKQVIIQKIRETERQSLLDEFTGKSGIMLNGTVHRFVDRNIIVDLGKTEGILPVREQIRREYFNIGDRIRVVVLKVERGTRGPKILLSRADPLLVRRLFEMEVPEVADKTVEIVDVVREPGYRSKIAVKSNHPKVDPVGACVGVKGSRVCPIIDELRGERIDLIAHSPDIEKYLAASLSPAKVSSVTIKSVSEKKAEIIVAEDMLSLAIGKNGQNARLAAKLTGWHIDIRTEGQKKEEARARTVAQNEQISKLDGVGPRTADVLIKGGWGDIERLAAAKAEDLTVLQGIGEKTAEKIIESARAEIKKLSSEASAKPELEAKSKE